MWREHNIVKGFTAPGEQMLSVISYVDLICKWLHSPFLNHPHLHSHYKPSEWNWSSLLLSESLCQDLLWWQWLQVLCQELLLLQHIADSASCTFFRWRRIFQPLTGLKCTGVFCVLYVFFFFFFPWLFLNFPEARNTYLKCRTGTAWTVAPSFWNRGTGLCPETWYRHSAPQQCLGL